MRLGEWVFDWLELYKAGLRENTIRAYQVAAGTIRKGVGDIDLALFDVEQLIRVGRWLLGRGKAAPRAAQLERLTLYQALRKAQAVGLISKALDIGEALPVIQHRAAETPFFTREQLRAYCQAVEVSGEPCAVLLLLCCCGLRRCEALGARWIDYERPQLMVRGQLIRGKWQPPKSAAGVRALILPERLCDLIDDTPRRRGCPWIVEATEGQLRAAHRRIMADKGWEGVTLHGLRHSFAMAATTSGCEIKLLQITLGHSKIGLTADLYAGHSFPPSGLPASCLRDVI